MKGRQSWLSATLKNAESEDVYANIDEMSDRIMKLPGVKRVKILTYNKRPILKKGKPLVY